MSTNSRGCSLSSAAILQRHLFLFIIISGVALAGAAVEASQLGASSFLTKFVTRPDIAAPLYDVTVHDEVGLEAGYWFVAPYASLHQSTSPSQLFVPCQTGPHIFDQRGELIWTGACQFLNRVACDFRVFRANDSTFLSTIFLPAQTDSEGEGVILDSTYSKVHNLRAGPGLTAFNMHELTYVNKGTRALYIVNRPMFVDLTTVVSDGKIESGWIIDIGLREVDIATGKVTFMWWASDSISVSESSAQFADWQNRAQGWNWIHLNSVNKNDDGDYIVSARFTNCIYKISGADGSIIWRLGGTHSDFKMKGFTFSRQHDAQWLYYNDRWEVIMFLDNGGDNFGYSTGNVSSVLVVHLDLETNEATVDQRIWRPDGAKSELRGNVQMLPNGNKFISWSDNSYITEHAADGRLLMSAQYSGKASVTYRAYKFPFEGQPSEEPILHATAYTAGGSSITVLSVSWNGATAVARWRFWREKVSSDSSDILLGEVVRNGFETSLQLKGHEEKVYAEAVDQTGSSLGKTKVVLVSMFNSIESTTEAAHIEPVDVKTSHSEL